MRVCIRECAAYKIIHCTVCWRVHRKMLQVRIILYQLLLLTAVTYASGACPRQPGGRAAHRTPGDGGFKIHVSGEPDKYVPNSVYTVSLKGRSLFTRFILVADSYPSSDDGTEASPQRVGSYQLFGDDSTTVFKHNCINTVSEQNNERKREVQAMWSAPGRGNGCVVLRAMIYIDDENWYADDGQLSRVVCELVEETSSKTSPSECCACDHAKYKLIFEGLWSNVTHPKDFPFSLWLTHFSDVIGGSHSYNFTLWREGQIASGSLRQVAEWGSVRSLEQELRTKGKYLKTLIKAAGLWYPRVNSNTTSSFRVDRSKHLVSVVSMFGPSPDWIVGISGLNLCLNNCSWIENQIIDLYPYDAGTDNGITYMSPNSPTIPQEPIHRITSLYPEDPRAPFYNPSGQEMNPLARIYITREKLIPKSCSDKTEDELLEDINLSENSEDTNRRECSVIEYSSWSPCSVSCGKGIRMRQREYVNPALALRAGCDRQLISKEMCVADIPLCPGDEEEYDTLSQTDSSVCTVTLWSDWSDCSSTCGEGLKMRTRHFLDRAGIKKCPHVTLIEKEKCMEPPCLHPEIPDPQCPTTEWSDWSPCSVSCGPGIRSRTRLLLADNKVKEECSRRIQLTQQHPCTGKKDCTIDIAEAKEICMLNAEAGPCRAYFQRWTFNTMKAMCIPFTYGGCRGNRNNFLTEEDCVRACSVVRDTLISGSNNLVSPVPQTRFTGDPVNCVVSSWTTWSQCSVSCGQGFKTKTRAILVEPKNGGTACPRTLTKRKRCYIPQEYCNN